MNDRNGGSRVLVMDGRPGPTQEELREQARVMAAGRFRGHVATVAAHVASGMIGCREIGTPGFNDALAREAVDIARRIVIESHKCEVPTDAELG